MYYSNGNRKSGDKKSILKKVRTLCYTVEQKIQKYKLFLLKLKIIEIYIFNFLILYLI